MTSQNSKSPESIAEDIVKEYVGNFKWESDHYWLKDAIAKAIKAERDKTESSYCSVCGACGEDGCCSPDCCKYIKHYDNSYQELLNENERLRAERGNNRLVLPERRVMNFEWGYEHENSSVFGFNRCLDEVIKLNEGRVKPLELPGYDNQCAHDASPSDFDRGAEYGFNKCLNEIYEMNPYLKLDEK